MSDTASIHDRLLATPSGEFAVTEAGTGGRPLLLVHGFTGAKEDFGDHLSWLADDGWHAVCPDLRGHGSSPKPADEDAYSLATFADDLVLIIDALGWDRLVLLGHSMGGMVAQVFTAANRSRLDGLILMDTNHGTFDLDPEVAQLGAEIARSEGMVALKAVLDEMGSPLDNPAFDRLVNERPGFQEFSDGKLLNSSPAMYAAMLLELTSNKAALVDHRAVDVPALVLVGEHDKPFLEPSRQLAATIPGASLAVLAGGGHSPQFESPDAWASAVRTFLSGL